jgi:hypothetical protein
MNSDYPTPNLSRRSFARTNPHTIAQRVALLKELLPQVTSIVELCCGDCLAQQQAYQQHLGVSAYLGLDIQPDIVAANRARGINCLCGDALDREMLRHFLDFDAVFFGPPLSPACQGHSLFAFQDVRPGYADFTRLLLGELGYQGTLVCIGPNTTTMGDIRRLYGYVKFLPGDYGLRLIHYSHASLTGDGTTTEPRLKYVELWFSSHLADAWEVRHSRPGNGQE